MTQRNDNCWSRRHFINTSIGMGYALAVMPIWASAISTPSSKLDCSDLKIPIGKDTIPAYFAQPQNKGRHPCVIVIHEIFGVHEYIRDVCRRLAKEGYCVIAPDLFSRYGDASKLNNIKELIQNIVSKTSQAEIYTDLDAVVTWLESHPGADSTRIGMTGFCWGGNITWMYAAHNSKLKAGVAWYGRLKGDTNPKQPKFPIDIAQDLNVPVLGLYGGKDEGIPIASVEEMRLALNKGKSQSQIIVYPEAGHAFHADYRPSFVESAAKKGWQELIQWFQKHGLAT